MKLQVTLEIDLPPEAYINYCSAGYPKGQAAIDYLRDSIQDDGLQYDDYQLINITTGLRWPTELEDK